MNQNLSKELLEKLRKVKAKRARTVIDHILKHGYITTEELKHKYKYEHPPRAARDVREQGIPLETFNVKDSKGKTIAAYKFDDLKKISKEKLGGRKAFSKAFKEKLVHTTHSKCAICLEQYDKKLLQVDHRIPYEVCGDLAFDENKTQEHMPLCGSCNRAKSWSCEHCYNWLDTKDPNICKTCYWASPENYTHIAGNPIRRLEIVWRNSEVSVYDRLKSKVKSNEDFPDYVKQVLKKHVENKK